MQPRLTRYSSVPSSWQTRYMMSRLRVSGGMTTVCTHSGGRFGTSFSLLWFVACVYHFFGWLWFFASHVRGRLVLTQAEEDGLAHAAVLRPFQERDLTDQGGSDPMDRGVGSGLAFERAF